MIHDGKTYQDLHARVASALAVLAREQLSQAGTAALAELSLALAVRPAPSAGLQRLTGRQRDVASLLACGYPNRAIAAALGIKESTAKLHVATVLSRLGLSSRAEVAALVAAEARR